MSDNTVNRDSGTGNRKSLTESRIPNPESRTCDPRPLYQFATTRFVSNSPWRQWWHLLSEVIEVGKALLAGDLQHAAAETWDVKQSSETLLRILSGRGADVEMARDTIIDNNQQRGYYQ